MPLWVSVYARRSDRQPAQGQMAMSDREGTTAAQQLADMQKRRARLDARIQSKAGKIAEQNDKENHRKRLRLGELLLDQCEADSALRASTLVELDQRLTRLVDRRLFADWGLPTRLRGLCSAEPLPMIPEKGWGVETTLRWKLAPGVLRKRHANLIIKPRRPFDARTL